MNTKTVTTTVIERNIVLSRDEVIEALVYHYGLQLAKVTVKAQGLKQITINAVETEIEEEEEQ
jgi:hypothetical protein